MAELQRLSTTHEAIMNWLVCNPERSLRDCSQEFGYTQAWLSSIIHSDLFQHALKEKQAAIGQTIAASIPEKLRRAADIAVEKLAEKLESSEDPEFILDATDKILHRLGFAPVSARNPLGGPGVPQVAQQQNNFFITAGDLEAAREQMQLAASTSGLSPTQTIIDAEAVHVARD